MSESTAQQPFGSTVVPIIVAVILTEALMYSLGSQYNPLSDDFDIANFLIDLGVFVTIAVAASWLYQRVFKLLRRKTTNKE
jgi:pilus assembly protein TadC